MQNRSTFWKPTHPGFTRLEHVELPLIAPGQTPAKYTVKLHFAALDEQVSPEFGLRLQGDTVATGIDVEGESGRNRANVKEFTDIDVADNLVVELVPRAGSRPTIAAIEVLRQD